MTASLSPAQRLGRAMAHQEPDRVPVLLAVNLHGAKELGLTLAEYFSSADHVVEGQLRLRRKYGHDALLGFLYAAVEQEAFGGEVIFADDGPPNAGAPVAWTRDQVLALEVPEISSQPALARVLEVIQRLARAGAGEVPVVGTVVAPASLPVMLLGFERYLLLLHEDPVALAHLIEITSRFAVAWGNAQLRAGAGLLAVFDPFSSPTVTDAALYRRVVAPATARVVAGLEGPAVLHLASGRLGDRLETIARSGVAGLAVSAREDLAAVKAACRGRLALIGNLSGVSMAGWTPDQAREHVIDAIRRAAVGGGFVLADNHGEIPFQVTDEVLHAVMDAAREFGRYDAGGVGGV